MKIVVAGLLVVLASACGTAEKTSKRDQVEQNDSAQADKEVNLESNLKLATKSRLDYKSFPSRWPAGNPSFVVIKTVEYYQGKCYFVSRMTGQGRNVMAQSQEVIGSTRGQADCNEIRRVYNKGMDFSGYQAFPRTWPAGNPSGVSVTNIEWYQGRCYEVVRRMSKSNSFAGAQNQKVMSPAISKGGCDYLKKLHDRGYMKK